MNFSGKGSLMKKKEKEMALTKAIAGNPFPEDSISEKVQLQTNRSIF